jgi:hypothetical protein
VKKEDLLNVLIGTKMIDIATGEELSYYSHNDEKIILLDENKLTVWLPYERVQLK